MQDDKKILIHAVIDLEQVQNIIEDATKIEDAPGLFEKLAEIAKVKKMLGDAEDALTSVEAQVKGMINAKAKQLYGDSWQAIKGNGFKISRQFTVAKYEQVGPAPEEFVIVKTTVNSKAVEVYVKENNELPKGIEVNQKRGESIRITVAEEADNGDSA